MEYVHAVLANHPLLVGLFLFFGPPIVGMIITREREVTHVDRPWTDLETRQLLDSLFAGIPMELTAIRMRRTLVDLVRRMESLGLFRRKA